MYHLECTTMVKLFIVSALHISCKMNYVGGKAFA